MPIDDGFANNSSDDLGNNASIAGTLKNLALHTGKSMIDGLVGNSKK